MTYAMKLDEMREEGIQQGESATMKKNLRSIMQKLHLTAGEEGHGHV